MPIDDFDLSPDMAAEPLDLSGFGGTPPFVPQQKQGGVNAKEFAPLLAILPVIAAKHGQGGIAALFRGMAASRAERQERARLASQDQRMASQEERMAAQARSQDEYRRAQLENDRIARQGQLRQQFGSALEGVDSPEAVKALIDFYGPQAQGVGMNPADFESFAMQTATPDRLTARKVSKRWQSMGQEAKELAQRTQASLQIDGQAIPYQTWAPLIGGMVDPKTGGYPQVAPKPEAPATPGSFEEYVNLPPDQQALRRQQRKEFLQSDDRQPAQAPAQAGGGRPLTQNQRANIIGSRRSQWTRFSKAVIDRQQAVSKIDSGVAALDRGNRNAATQAIILAFNKLQDETSVVREGEYARAEQLAPIVSRIDAFFTRLNQGGGQLTDDELRKLAFEAKETAKALEAVTNEAAANLRQSIGEELGDYQIPTSRVFGSSTIGARKSAAPKVDTGRMYNHPQLGKVRVIGTNPDGTVKVEKVVP